MPNPNLGSVITDEWERTLKETPDPFRESDVFFDLFGRTRPSYQERLDRLRRNVYGELIARKVVVRRNLRQLGRIRLNPTRLPA